MLNKIPDKILDIYKKIQNEGFDIYLVGGCVRNLIMDITPKDWDLTTNATPEQILKIFPDGFYDNQFGTVGIPIELEEKKQTRLDSTKARQVIEITTFRSERNYKDRRHPEIVEWGKTLNEDLERRDFTINAIALRLSGTDRIAQAFGSEAQARRGKPSDFEIIDPFDGRKDIKNKIVRAVGDPKKRFKEDALRLMRVIRFATEHSFIIEEDTWNEILADAKLIEEISKERIRDELLKILGSNYPYEGVMLLKNSRLLEFIIPELLEGIDVSQARPGRHHTEDVFTHNLLSLKFCPSTDPVIRFAALLHDIGKPRAKAADEENLVTFHNHEIISTNIAKDICDRLKFSKKQHDKVVNLIRWHMFTVDEKITDAAVRRFIRRVGVKNVKDMMDLRIGDRLGGGTQTAESWRLKLFKKRVEEQLQPAPFSINDLVIDGNDVMKELGIKPSKKIGEILQKLFEEVDEDLSKNNRESLLKRIKELV